MPTIPRLPLVILFLIVSRLALAVPTIATRVPAAGATVSSLSSIAITFSEAVTGVDADDLLINADAALFVTGAGAGPYVFTFTQPPPGTVNVNFDGDHGIAGQIGSGAFAGASWTYTLTDTVAPTIAQTTPATGATVGSMARAEVVFSEVVTGVDAADLLVNGTPATAVTGSGFGPYLFTFAQPAVGAVNFTWAAGHGIADVAAAPNAFAGGGWAATLSATGIGNLIINEFLAANGTGLADENVDQGDWIEIYNAGAATVSLAGWALTNDHGDLAQWVFPAWTLGAGKYLVVYASGKNRRSAQTTAGQDNANTVASPRLHTNFTINENGGYLALVGPDAPRVAVSQFPANYNEAANPPVTEYPEQRTDFSYGPQPGGALRYFGPSGTPATAPTPGAANPSTSTLTSVMPKVNVSVGRGFFKDAFSLVLTCPEATATIRYTTDFTEPTAATGTVYTVPLTISATTCLRAVAFGTNKIPSLPVTYSYLFLDQVLTQPNTPQSASVGGSATATFPTNWGTAYASNTFPPASSVPGLVPADYEMDSDPVRVTPTSPASAIDPVKQQRLRDGLRELAILSITIPMADMFTTAGLYAVPNVENKNFGYKKCAAEMILPDGSSAFSAVCGIGGHGNASRTPLKNPKHGFQLKFKGDYGDGSLHYQMYADSPVQDFDDIILRPDFNSSWRHWSDDAQNSGNLQRTRATRTRDAFVKDTFLAMGQPASHHRFFNLFINGLYWGVYDFAEQPVDGFGKSYYGGAKSDYDVIHEGNVRAGDATVYTAMTGQPNTTSNALYDAMKGYLDLPEFIDYMLLHFYIAHQDWGNVKNWYAIRRRASAANPTPGKFVYLPWDDECTLLDSNLDQVNGDIASLGRPSGLHPKLVFNAQYKLDFADRVHRHLVAPGGVLTSAPMIARWLKWQAVLDKAIVAESCRWGDYRKDVHNYQTGTYPLYTRENQWLAEHTRMTGLANPPFVANPNGYFLVRTALLRTQLQTAGLYPATAAPEYRLNTTGGTIVGTSQVAAGSVIALNNPGAGFIYYTTDGNDPHIVYTATTGASTTSIAPTATEYSAALTINGTVTIKSRVLSSKTAGTWSALNEATFTVGIAQPAVRITELMYNPPGGNAYEFIELQNTGATPVNVGGWNFSGVDYYFPLGTVLSPGDRLVLGNNDGANGLFAARYPGVAVLGYFGGSLDNNGETIALKDASDRTIASVTYGDHAPWPVTPDGGGYSLEIIDANGDPDSFANWKASAVVKGTPGQANSVPSASALVLNEVLAVNTSGLGYIELKNTGGSTIDLNGWTVAGTTGSFTFGAGANVLAGNLVAVSCGPGGSIPTALNAAGGAVRLRNPAGEYVDAVSFGNQIADFAIGRVAGAWTLTNPTVAADNIAASLAAPAGNLVINEWLPNAAASTADWIELYNKHATLPVAIGGLFFQTDTQLYRYPSLSFLAPLAWLQLFCDEQPGYNQLDFKLPATGTALSILDASANVIDTISLANFGTAPQGVSRGRTTDGAAAFSTFTGSASPGAANYVNAWTGPVLNEVLARNSTGDIAPWGTRADWVELYNPNASPFTLDAMKLGLANNAATAWIFPAGTSIPALGWLHLWCDFTRSASTSADPDLNTALNLGDLSGALYLFNTGGQAVDRVEWGTQLVDRSFGLDSGTQKLLANPTRGAANSAAATLGATTALKINEWLALPVSGGDWFEIFNPGANPVNLAGLYLTDDPGEIGRAKFTVPPLSFIAAGGLVKWDADSAPEIGRNHVNFTLDSNAEYLRLSNNDANLTVIDAVSFGQQLAGVAQGRIADGGAVQLLLAPTPAASNTVLLAPSIVTHPASTAAAQGTTALFNVVANSASPMTYQWRFNLANIANATNATLSLTNVAPASEGAYSVVVANAAGSTPGNPGTLLVQSTFAQWAAAHGISGATGDADGDGIGNLAEFFHNLDPLTASDRTALPQFAIEPPTGTPLFLTLTYRINARALLTGLDYQTSIPLTGWTTVAPDVTENLTPDAVTGDPRVRVKFSIAPGETKKFLRLLLTQ